MRGDQTQSTDVHIRPCGYKSPPRIVAQTCAEQQAPLVVYACIGNRTILRLNINDSPTWRTTMAILQDQPNVFLRMYNLIKLRDMGMTQSTMMINLPCQPLCFELLGRLYYHLLLPWRFHSCTFVLVIVWCARYTFPKDPIT
jgi:hypothetical protein